MDTYQSDPCLCIPPTPPHADCISFKIEISCMCSPIAKIALTLQLVLCFLLCWIKIEKEHSASANPVKNQEGLHWIQFCECSLYIYIYLTYPPSLLIISLLYCLNNKFCVFITYPPERGGGARHDDRGGAEGVLYVSTKLPCPVRAIAPGGAPQQWGGGAPLPPPRAGHRKFCAHVQNFPCPAPGGEGAPPPLGGERDTS